MRLSEVPLRGDQPPQLHGPASDRFRSLCLVHPRASERRFTARLARCQRPREGPLTEPTAGAQPWPRERYLRPSGICVYIICNDGITLCRTAPATVNDGEIVVASNEELRAAPLSAKRLLALWNALPNVEKRKKVGDRDALIDQLWSAIEALPDPEPQPDPKPPSKQEVVIAMLRLPEGATVDEVASVTGWQRHTVRGVFSGTLKKKLGLTLASAKEERGRVYRIAEPASL